MIKNTWYTFLFVVGGMFFMQTAQAACTTQKSDERASEIVWGIVQLPTSFILFNAGLGTAKLGIIGTLVIGLGGVAVSAEQGSGAGIIVSGVATAMVAALATCATAGLWWGGVTLLKKSIKNFIGKQSSVAQNNAVHDPQVQTAN